MQNAYNAASGLFSLPVSFKDDSRPSAAVSFEQECDVGAIVSPITSLISTQSLGLLQSLEHQLRLNALKNIQAAIKNHKNLRIIGIQECLPSKKSKEFCHE